MDGHTDATKHNISPDTRSIIIIFPKGLFFIGAPCWFESIAPGCGDELEAL